MTQRKDTGRRILITGANGGMGRECTELALEQGYQLVLADLPSAGFDEFSRRLAERGAEVSSYSLDVTDANSIADLAAALQQSGGVEAIVHTVGISPNMADWKRIVEIDLVGTAKFLEAVRPGLVAGGVALCISSSSGYMCPANAKLEQVLANPLAADMYQQLTTLENNPLENPGLAYSYAKRALQRFVAARSGAWGGEGKRLLSLSPGLISTEMGQLEYEASKNFAAMKKQIALGRLGKPEEIASTALFLVSEQASYITGCDILVDGGLIAGFRQAQALL